jgi:hypothetical protein
MAGRAGGVQLAYLLIHLSDLLMQVLDTPDFFWSASDALRVLYDKVSAPLVLSVVFLLSCCHFALDLVPCIKLPRVSHTHWVVQADFSKVCVCSRERRHGGQ